MIETVTRTRMRARPVGDNGQLAYGWYAYLEYSQDAPYEVRLAAPGPYPVEVTFARDILRSALRGEPDGHGGVRARLEYVRAVKHSMVLIAVDLPDPEEEDSPEDAEARYLYQGVLALDDKAVASFLDDTEDLVAFGGESRYLPDLDAEIAGILGKKAA